jgi:glycosyltransferase involved in cell wall biosynthesis/spore maturation protein CgeB
MSVSSSNAGFRILLLDTKSENPNHYICLAIREALKGMAGVDFVVKADYSNAVSLAVQHHCNLFLAFDGEAMDRLICSRVAAVCGTSVLWVTEDPYEMSVNVANADLFNLVFTNDSSCVAAYGEKGRHLPLAGAKPFHFLPIQEDPKALRYDVFFAGTAWPNRVALLKQVLESNWGGEKVKAKIALPTNPYLPPVDLPLPLSQINWRTSPADFTSFANKSLSTLVLPRVFSASGNRDFAETPPPRLYEAALAGTVQLVQSKLTEAGQYFEAGQDFLYFDSAKDLIEKLAALRADINWRNQISRRAQDKALAKHCYENRMAVILDEVRKLKQLTPPTRAVISKAAGKPKILFVVHNVVGNINFGGVEVYLKHITGALAQEYEPYFYMSNPHSHPNSTVLLDSQGSIIRTYEFSQPLSIWQLSCIERQNAFVSVLTNFDISLIHFHHLIGHVPSLVEIAQALGVPTVMTMHDHYAICHEFMLLSFKGQYCHPDEIALSQCDICLWHKHNILPGGQAARRTYWDRILGMVGTLIFNTSGSRELTAKIYPSVSGHKDIAILPVPRDPVQVQTGNKLPKKNSLNIAILGNFLHHKGSEVINRVMPLFKGSNVEFHIFGRINVQYEYLRSPEEFPFIHVYGAYEPGQIPEEINSCEVSLHLSIWPETYCLTLSEAWDRGLVPIVSDLGALGERVTDGVNGLKIKPDSEGDLEQAIHRLMETPGLLESLRKNIGSAPISRTEPHVAGLRKIYGESILRSELKTASEGLLKGDSLKSWHPMIANWASVLLPPPAPPPVGLARRVVRHIRKRGLLSMLQRSVQYLKERL